MTDLADLDRFKIYFQDWMLLGFQLLKMKKNDATSTNEFGSKLKDNN